MITDAELKDWRAKAETATPGPWAHADGYCIVRAADLNRLAACDSAERNRSLADYNECTSNAAFIAIGPDNFIRLLDEVRMLRELRDALKADVTEVVGKRDRLRTVLQLIEVDLTAGEMPAKTRVALALDRVRAALGVKP